MMEYVSNPAVNDGKPIPLITMGEKLPPGFMETYFPNWPTLGDLYRAEKEAEAKREAIKHDNEF